MAQNLQQLRRRIKTSKNIAQIAKAMEMISASKIKRAQKAVESNKPYADKISELTHNLLRTKQAQMFQHPFIKKNTSPNKFLIAVASDKGLSGSFNTNVIKKLVELENKNTYLVTLGKKTETAASRLNYNFIAAYPMGNTLPAYSDLYNLTQLINEYIADNKVGSVEILYTEFQSLFTQVPVVKKLLPIAPEEESESLDKALIVEPDVETLLTKLLPQYFEVQLYQSLIEAYTSEQAARMVAMQNAKNNALDIADYLTLVYNKSRQERITNEILDVANNIQ